MCALVTGVQTCALPNLLRAIPIERGFRIWYLRVAGPEALALALALDDRDRSHTVDFTAQFVSGPATCHTVVVNLGETTLLAAIQVRIERLDCRQAGRFRRPLRHLGALQREDRKSTRLNSSH